MGLASQVYGESYHVQPSLLLQPADDDGGIQPSAIGKHYFISHRAPFLATLNYVSALTVWERRGLLGYV